MSRKRWVYTQGGQPIEGGPVCVDEGWTDVERAPVATEGIVYGNLRATDGTDISSRTKHERYMKERGLALTSDFSEHWEKKAKERAAGESAADAKERRDTIGRALHEAGPEARRRITQQVLATAKTIRRR